VVTGADLALLDTTGTLTQKYQARLIRGQEAAELVTSIDTNRLAGLIRSDCKDPPAGLSPIVYPCIDYLKPISLIFACLQTLVGTKFNIKGHDQERNRGAALHRLICQKLGYSIYQDDGRFPDIRNQLLEIKLQTSPTIDLGLVSPDSTDPLDIPQLAHQQIRHCDVRYALFYAVSDARTIRLTNFYLTTGEEFFRRFPQFQGRVLNKKLQIPLPSGFFAG